MESKRQQKFSKMIQKELADIFQRDAKSLFEGAFITVTHVKVSPDLGFARVFVSFLLAGNKKEVLENLKANKAKVRNLLGMRIKKQVRVIPELEFQLDESLDHAQKMEDLFAQIQSTKKQNDPGQDENQPED